MPCKAVHVQFDGGSYKGHTLGSFIILEVDSVEIVWAGQCYGAKCPKNEAKSFVLWDTL